MGLREASESEIDKFEDRQLGPSGMTEGFAALRIVLCETNILCHLHEPLHRDHGHKTSDEAIRFSLHRLFDHPPDSTLLGRGLRQV